MYRNALEFIKKWYRKENRKPLIIRGARQVGKSYLVREFARRESLSLVEVNFEKNPEVADLFGKQSIKRTCEFLEIQYKVRIEPQKTLLFLDEIQAAPQVIPVLRYFYEERPELCLVTAGSLLEFVLKDHSFSMPVGRLEYMHLGPMTFEEFLEANGEAGAKKFIGEFHLKDPMPLPLHQRLMDQIRIYCVTGGMPEAVKAFLHSSWEGCEAAKSNILSTYADDFSKYRHRIPDVRLRKVFQKIPRLVGEKLKYVNIDPLERAKDLNLALDLLCMARVGYRIYHSAANGVPLGAEINEKFFKLLFLDIGLACSVCGLNLLDFERAEDVNLVNQGRMAEQLVGQHLLYDLPLYQAPELYYWARAKNTAAAAIDYMISKGPQVIPVEVKSGKSGSLKSLHLFLKEKRLSLGIRFNSEPPTVLKAKDFTLISLPFYFVGQWRRLYEEHLDGSSPK
ncbi:MAG: ATP-binding protein [Deltaproteobacteria bacterium]|nr:ATP-binding protein [Deltaproteobacteria bacterium]